MIPRTFVKLSTAVCLLAFAFGTPAQASRFAFPEVPDELNLAAAKEASQVYGRSESSFTKDPTHQHPQHIPPEILQKVQVSKDFTVLNNPTLARRDATNCLSDGSCADGSCCSNKGTCGWGAAFCGNGNCTIASNNKCESAAMCGKDSKGGKVKCGMNLCCSATGWCGTSELYCVNGDPQHLSLPCQQNFGSCQVKSGRTCGFGTGSTNGRKIGYYQGSNTRNRLCNLIYPKDIVTTGYTHLNYAFASINPTTFAVMPADPADVPLYFEFTALINKGVQPWIAVGGFDFSDANQATHGTWSKLCATQDSRAKFIDSLLEFMPKYGFKGVDLDWEYPVAPERGGAPEDTANLVLLVQEMRAKFAGRNLGISLTLAPDYWYLRYFDAKAMEPSVDFFGFMAYDLHGFWDKGVKTLAPVVRGQADIRDIENNTLPLWFDELDPSKINFGVALYGRGYTVSDSSCNGLNCPFKGPSKPGRCSNSDGAMGLTEIQDLIKTKGLTPKYLPEAMMKEITWDDQWVGYDDADTIKEKKAWADNQCFGGTMAWSVDFDSGIGSGMEPKNTTDGSCGKANGNTVCGDWPQGSCCSSSGFCGNSNAHCGVGCQSGDCTTGGETTDGRCGSAYKDTVCGAWSQGDCCSAAGFCGRSQEHCGDGCQSGSCGWRTFNYGTAQCTGGHVKDTAFCIS